MSYREESLLTHLAKSVCLLEHICNYVALELFHLVPHELEVSLTAQKDVAVCIRDKPAMLGSRPAIIQPFDSDDISRIIYSLQARTRHVFFMREEVNLSSDYDGSFFAF